MQTTGHTLSRLLRHCYLLFTQLINKHFRWAERVSSESLRHCLLKKRKKERPEMNPSSSTTVNLHSPDWLRGTWRFSFAARSRGLCTSLHSNQPNGSVVSAVRLGKEIWKFVERHTQRETQTPYFINLITARTAFCFLSFFFLLTWETPPRYIYQQRSIFSLGVTAQHDLWRATALTSVFFFSHIMFYEELKKGVQKYECFESLLKSHPPLIVKCSQSSYLECQF